MNVKIKWEWGAAEVKSFKNNDEANDFLDKNEECIDSCIWNYNDHVNFNYKKVKDQCDYTDYEMDMYL